MVVKARKSNRRVRTKKVLGLSKNVRRPHGALQRPKTGLKAPLPAIKLPLLEAGNTTVRST